jgi:hypothetical protein
VKNLGKIERGIRLTLGLLLAGVVLARPTLGAIEWTGTVIALFLVLNAVFGRCYLWHVLEFSSCGCNPLPPEKACSKPAA